MVDSENRTLGWIGVGRMGTEMVTRLLQSGHRVTVYNRTIAKVEPLATMGASIAATAADLASCAVIFVCVSSSSDLQSVLIGEHGLLSTELAPEIVVDFSTVSAASSAEVRARLAERGTNFLAAPVSGNPKVARSGQLTMAVSGPRAGFDAVSGYLAAMGSGATYVGEGETARLVKLCHNLFLGVVIQSLVEVTVLAEKGGVSRKDFLAYLNHSVMGSLFTGYKTPALVNADFKPTFTSNLLRKDFDLGLAAARELEVVMPVAALVHQIVQSLVGLGFGESDFAALLELAASNSGLELRSEDAEVPDGLSHFPVAP